MALKTPQKLLIVTILLLGAAAVLHSRRTTSEPDSKAKETAKDEPAGRTPSSTPAASAGTPSPQQPPGFPRDDKRDEALARLERESQQKWQTVLDAETGRLRTLEGGRLEIPANDGSAGLVQNAQAFLERYAHELFGVAPTGLRFDKVVDNDRSKVIFEQYIDGRRVLGGTLALVYEQGALVRVQSDLVPETLARPAGQEVALEQALSYVATNGDQKFAASDDKRGSRVKPLDSPKPELVFVPHPDQLISAYAIYVDRFNSNDERIDRARVLVDAIAPRIIKTDRMIFN